MADDPFPDTPPDDEELERALPEDEPGVGVPWGALIALLGLALVVVFAVQNTEPVPVEFLWLEGEYPLALVILITAAAAVLIAQLVAYLYRRRRRRRLAEQQELRRYREAG
jgi:uncharacterized integral membrane protein